MNLGSLAFETPAKRRLVSHLIPCLSAVPKAQSTEHVHCSLKSVPSRLRAHTESDHVLGRCEGQVCTCNGTGEGNDCESCVGVIGRTSVSNSSCIRFK